MDSITVINTMTKSILERKGLIPSLWFTDHHEEKSGQEVKTGGTWRGGIV